MLMTPTHIIFPSQKLCNMAIEVFTSKIGINEKTLAACYVNGCSKPKSLGNLRAEYLMVTINNTFLFVQFIKLLRFLKKNC